VYGQTVTDLRIVDKDVINAFTTSCVKKLYYTINDLQQNNSLLETKVESQQQQIEALQQQINTILSTISTNQG
jgi:cell division protein FtsL